MSRRIKKKPLRKLAIGDMNTPVKLLLSTLGAPFDSIHIKRENDVVIDPWFCSVQTISGLTLFGQSNVEEVITHRLSGRYVEGITIDHMVNHAGTLHRIVTMENYEDRNEYLVLNCTSRGPEDVPVNQA